MSFRSGKFKSFKKAETDCKCGHPHVCHYTKEGHCVYQACECKAFDPKGRQPFQNERARCEYGHAHNSGLEIKECFSLHCQKLAGKIKDYRAEVLTDLTGPSGAVVARYKVDFVVEHLDGTTEFVEAKGGHIRHLPPWPLKWALLQDKHRGDPLYRFRVVEG